MAWTPNYIVTIGLFKLVVPAYSPWFLGKHKQPLNVTVIWLKNCKYLLEIYKSKKKAAQAHRSPVTCHQSIMVHLKHVMKDMAKDLPPQPQDMSHPAGSLSLDVQAQLVSIHFLLWNIYLMWLIKATKPRWESCYEIMR